MGCPSSRRLIAHNVKVSIQSQHEMHQENHRADQKSESSAKMRAILILAEASVCVYEDDRCSRTSAPTDHDCLQQKQQTGPQLSTVDIFMFVIFVLCLFFVCLVF